MAAGVLLSWTQPANAPAPREIEKPRQSDALQVTTTIVGGIVGGVAGSFAAEVTALYGGSRVACLINDQIVSKIADDGIVAPSFVAWERRTLASSAVREQVDAWKSIGAAITEPEMTRAWRRIGEQIQQR
jgi:hypothetical protein